MNCKKIVYMKYVSCDNKATFYVFGCDYNRTDSVREILL